MLFDINIYFIIYLKILSPRLSITEYPFLSYEIFNLYLANFTSIIYNIS